MFSPQEGIKVVSRQTGINRPPVLELVGTQYHKLCVVQTVGGGPT